MRLTRFAPAKVNLFLHVGPVAADGYHPVCSLMVFADVGDWVSLDPDAASGLHIQGPFGLALEGGDNLVLAARDRFHDRFGPPPQAFGLILDKQLPIAAGLGGGSADAAATLRLLAQARGVDPAEHGPIGDIARGLGADMLACLRARPVLGEGRGDRLAPAPDLPPLDAVLVNPGIPSSTAAVYRAFDSAPAGPGADRPDPVAELTTARRVAEFLAGRRNDLEAPAVALQPLIGAALASLAAQPETLLARMSGSGATCFALCENAAAARTLAARLVADHPAWWIRACRLSG